MLLQITKYRSLQYTFIYNAGKKTYTQMEYCFFIKVLLLHRYQHFKNTWCPSNSIIGIFVWFVLSVCCITSERLSVKKYVIVRFFFSLHLLLCTLLDGTNMSECCLTPTPPFCLLRRGENKLICNVVMIMFSLY